MMRLRIHAKHFFFALCAIILAACVSQVPAPLPPLDTSAPADFPESHYRDAAALGKRVLRVRPDQSLVAIDVRRGGPLARLGHDHVVASRDVRGYVLADEGRADLYIPLNRLTVDEAALRTEAGLDPQMSADAIAGTRRNMLDKVLEAERYPYALVSVVREREARLKVSVTLHGATKTFDVPAEIAASQGKLAVAGRMTIHQSDFGITPFSVLGGALQVEDGLEMRFRIAAE